MVKINLYGTEILTRYKCRSWLNTQTQPPLISVIRKYIDHDFNILDECTFGNRANFLQDAQIREEERYSALKLKKIVQIIFKRY